MQVDSKHEDELTQRRLDELDRPRSEVLAVVSVNKLKEGWDVKNIAVVVTLRAMASEVLTQQTMGRGLRLPFGKHTGVGQIDQLDIIAHQSFTELLNAENVLEQFGLEEALAERDKDRVENAIRHAVQTSERESTAPDATRGRDQSEGQATTWPGSLRNDIADLDTSPGTPPITGDGNQQIPGIGVRVIPVSEGGVTPAQQWEPVSIQRNPAFAEITYHFPVTRMKVQQPQIDLSDISDAQVEQAARRVTSTGEVLLRKEVIAALGKKLRVEDRESAQVDSVHIQDADAKDALVKLVMNMQLVPKTEQTARYVAAFLVPRFMKDVSFTSWTVKSLASAQNELTHLIRAYTAETLRATREVPTIHPKPMPCEGYTLPLGEEVHDQVDSRDEFVRGRVYSGWFKSLFAEESFDSYTGEYVLARLLNTSPSIVWWHRLHPQDHAFIYYNAKDRYFPDFVALDTDGVYWIIEGKSERGRDDAQVQAKRGAAESLVRRLVAQDRYEGQNWGYLIAYEQDTARADSWEDLKALAQPVSNAL